MEKDKYIILGILGFSAAVAVTILNIINRRKLSDISYQQGWLEGYCDGIEEKESKNEVNNR